MSILWPSPGFTTITQPFGNFTNDKYPTNYMKYEPAGYLQDDDHGHRRYRKSSFQGGIYHPHIHPALDIKMPIGTVLIAPAAGKIVAAGTYNDTGEHYLMLKIRTEKDEQIVWFITHLSKIIAQIGDKVDAGDRIAKSGASGHVTGPHLHAEMRITGNLTLDPHLSTSWFKYNWRRMLPGGNLQNLVP